MSDRNGVPSEYVIAALGPTEWQLVKFTGGDQPEATYTVRYDEGWTCDCPAGHYRGVCKHTGMVKTWQQQQDIQRKR